MSCGDNLSRGCAKYTSPEGGVESTSCSYWSCDKLSVFNWLHDLPTTSTTTDIVEVRFKNTRKGFYKNINKLQLEKGDVVAVEASPGHDIGIVSLTGHLVLKQMKKNNVSPEGELKKIYRKAKPADIEKWKKAAEMEHTVMLQARQISYDLKLEMKIGDVEYQGDKTKAIFYYIADERVDFRELIKVLADRFKIRVEMRQIGARQEAGRIGGIGSCGRELCCATWITNFVSVTTNAARYQEISLNPQKLAGQCGKLKCCLNYELESYIDAQKDFPVNVNMLQTEEGTVYHQKTDIFKGIMWFSYQADSALNAIPVSVERVKTIQELNKNKQKVKSLIDPDLDEVVPPKKIDVDYANVVGEESLTRFDSQKKKKKKKKRKLKTGEEVETNASVETKIKEEPTNEVAQAENMQQPQREVVQPQPKQKTIEVVKQPRNKENVEVVKPQRNQENAEVVKQPRNQENAEVVKQQRNQENAEVVKQQRNQENAEVVKPPRNQENKQPQPKPKTNGNAQQPTKYQQRFMKQQAANEDSQVAENKPVEVQNEQKPQGQKVIQKIKPKPVINTQKNQQNTEVQQPKVKLQQQKKPEHNDQNRKNQGAMKKAIGRKNNFPKNSQQKKENKERGIQKKNDNKD